MLLHYTSSTLKHYLPICYKFCSTTNKLKILQIKNNSMLIVQDPQSTLSYMSQITTQQGNQGIVIKIQQNNKSVIGMYNQINNHQSLNIKNVNKSWKQSIRSIMINNNNKSGIYDVNGNSIIVRDKQIDNVPNTNNQQVQTQTIQLFNYNKNRLLSTSPVLNTCYDMYYGDMINFTGCRGSKKTQNAFSIIKQFTSQGNNQSICIYVNPTQKQSVELINKNNKTIAFTVQKGKKPTDIGVYMLALKAINFSIQLKNNGKNVLLVVDNLNHIMMRQWTMLQSIKFNSKSIDSSKMFQYNTLKISPVSLMNEIYANCQHNQKNMSNHQNNNKNNKSITNNNKNKKGSLTSILISQRQNNQLVQQITHFSNNLKHLQTLSKVIQFPIDSKINTNMYSKKQLQSQLKNQQITQINQIYKFMRNYVNELLKEKSQTQLKRSLYKNQFRDAPWDYFLLLDSQWCIKDFNQLTFQSFNQTTKFLKWIKYNLENDLAGHWNLSAKQSFNKLVNYIKNQRSLPQQTSLKELNLTGQDFQMFIEQQKMQGTISPFKKDYLN